MKARPVLLILTALLVLLGIGIWIGNHRKTSAVSMPSQPPSMSAQSRLGRPALLPIPQVPELSKEKVALGQRLFFDKQLSRDNTLSCADCHPLMLGGADRRRFSTGVNGRLGNINTPTVFNASLNFVQFWDGRASGLEEQAAGPIHNPAEMASNWDEVVSKLSRDASYVKAFEAAYGTEILPAAIADAIATYERTLLTPNARFDQYLTGNTTRLTALELAGYQRFLDYGCVSCHQGMLIGGNMFQRFGVMGDYFKDRKQFSPSPADLGRFNLTGREEDRHVFKVPSLRNVATTAPYFHDGSASSLEEAVAIMGRYQLGRELAGTDVDAIVAFLGTLTGEWEGKPLQ